MLHGGGMILVPAFIYLLNLDDRTSRATSAFCILPWVITSGFFYYKNNFIDWRIGILTSIGGIIGGYFGAKLLKKLPVKYLQAIFIIFISYAAIKMIIA